MWRDRANGRCRCRRSDCLRPDKPARRTGDPRQAARLGLTEAPMAGCSSETRMKLGGVPSLVDHRTHHSHRKQAKADAAHQRIADTGGPHDVTFHRSVQVASGNSEAWRTTHRLASAAKSSKPAAPEKELVRCQQPLRTRNRCPPLLNLTGLVHVEELSRMNQIRPSGVSCKNGAKGMFDQRQLTHS